MSKTSSVIVPLFLIPKLIDSVIRLIRAVRRPIARFANQRRAESARKMLAAPGRFSIST